MKNSNVDAGDENPLLLIGFRQDRLGARLVTLANVIRVARALDIDGRYLWLSQPDGPYPDLTDPAEIFSEEFIAKWIRIVSDIPSDLQDRYNCAIEFKKINKTNALNKMKQGDRFWTENGSDILYLMDENPKTVAMEFRAAFSEIKFSKFINARFKKAMSHIGADDSLAAFHVRRGDILDGDPWSLTRWPRKYVPDEFYAAAVKQVDGPIVAFTDTPAALEHLRRTQPGAERITPIYDALDLKKSSRSQRDLLELLVLSHAAKIYAPVQSAFSTAASLISGNPIVPLPRGLGSGHLEDAHDRLLNRAIDKPESFFVPGDLAQSLQFAARHAMVTNRTKPLLDSMMKLDENIFSHHPFLLRLTSELAIASGNGDVALAFSKKAFAAEGIWKRDKIAAKIVNLAARKWRKPESLAILEDYCAAIFDYSNETSASHLLKNITTEYLGNAKFCRAFLVEPDGLDVLGENVSGKKTILQAVSQEEEVKLTSLWPIMTDWIDLIKGNRGRREISTTPSLHPRLDAFGPDMNAVLQNVLSAGQTPTDHLHQLQLGRMASSLSLFGRYKKALDLLNALLRNEVTPMNLKRQADLHYRIGHEAKALMYLKEAVELAPDCHGLQLSCALGYARSGQFNLAKKHTDMAKEIWPGSKVTDLAKKQIHKMRKPS
ncbi:tetratricopeptide repeat protein [Paracoccus onubensis]|uniref:tetratricopeptide repeat protein n=1 Tax=Paracoccus onubensis TaxID=1675788 RepID=UPI002731CE48|nr:tetratricopeptide repeat protein [Paracoccus onubensis]MDP0927749.1 tetratricopeptide repeat protein [Paracoccus onubensis]